MAARQRRAKDMSALISTPVCPDDPDPAVSIISALRSKTSKTQFAVAEKKYPTVEWVKRSGARPYAQVGIHDPDGQVVDINQKNMSKAISEVKTNGLYLEGDHEQPRHVEYLALRTPNPAHCAEFYHDVFKLAPLNRHEDDETYSLTDGRVTLKLIPWKIADFDG